MFVITWVEKNISDEYILKTDFYEDEETARIIFNVTKSDNNKLKSTPELYSNRIIGNLRLLEIEIRNIATKELITTLEREHDMWVVAWVEKTDHDNYEPMVEIIQTKKSAIARKSMVENIKMIFESHPEVYNQRIASEIQLFKLRL